MHNYEILAPAGNLEDLKLMIREGADAIYVGLKGYSSRPGSADFSMEEIREAVTLCHENQVLLYLAVNANVGEDQMEHLIEELLEADRMGVDSLILAEFGLIRHLSGKLQHAALHASTLMGVYNTETVRLLKTMGVSRIIFYANLYFDEMAKIISAEPELEYELVAEGGTCFNDIRQCRIPHGVQDGKQILFCRKDYDLKRGEEILGSACPISEPPTRVVEVIGLYREIGITSFKIEGRTVPGIERVPMVRDLKKYLEAYEAHPSMEGCLHYLTRGNRRRAK